MWKKYNIWIFVAIIVLIPSGVYGVVKWYENKYTKLPVLGPAAHSIGDFNLVNQYGAVTSVKDWNNKIIVAHVFFTHCPGVCPKMIRNLKKIQQAYIHDKDIELFSFTVDPERDSSGQLLHYATQLDIRRNWLLLTGDKKEIYKLARKGLLVVATDGDGGPNDFIHSEQLVLIDKAKRIRGFYKGTDPAETENLLRDISQLKEEYR